MKITFQQYRIVSGIADYVTSKTQPRAAVLHDSCRIQHDRRLLSVHRKSESWEDMDGVIFPSMLSACLTMVT